METGNRTGKFLLIIGLFGALRLFSQDTDAPDPGPPLRKKSKLLTGFYVGSYFANKYSASTYNGYGFDVNGQRNSFVNSFMYQKIINQFGGGYGQYDQIAAALGVDQHQWSFSESDMPVNMHYTTSFQFGFNFKVPVDRKSAIILNINGSKLGVQGNFTIETLNQQNTNPAFNNNVQICSIQGGEQRLQFEVGFQRILGDDDQLNFFAEGGFVGTLSEFDKNSINIKGLNIDLTTYVNQTLYPQPGPTKRPIGFGIGAFVGGGLNIDLNTKFTVQLLYTLADEKINIGTNPTLKLQNGLGLRVYYNL